MNKKELSSLEHFGKVEDNDLFFGKSASGGKYGFFPASMLGSKGYACRRWNLNNSTPIGEAVGNIDYLRELPSLLGLGCYLVDDAHNRRKLDPANHYKLATGETAKLDGSMGQYMWGWRTPFYIAWWVEGDYFYLAASLKPIAGRACYKVPIASVSAMHCGVMDRTNTKLCSLISTEEQYRGGNGSALTTGTAAADNLSMLGYAATAISTANFETYAAKRGAGWGAGWYWIETVTMMLFQLIMGTRNCQAAFNASKDANGLYQGGLGSGVSGMPSWEAYNAYYPVVPTSAGVELGDAVGVGSYAVKKADGTTAYTAPIPVFFGLKNPYGHLWVGKNRIVGVKNADASYSFYVAKSSLTTWNYSDTANMIHVGGIAAPASASWDYIKTINFEGLAGMPAERGATASTHYCDGAYLDTATSGFGSPLGSGIAGYGANGGLACFNGSTAPSNSTAYLSSPLCEVQGDFDPRPTVYAD